MQARKPALSRAFLLFASGQWSLQTTWPQILAVSFPESFLNSENFLSWMNAKPSCRQESWREEGCSFSFGGTLNPWHQRRTTKFYSQGAEGQVTWGVSLIASDGQRRHALPLENSYLTGLWSLLCSVLLLQVLPKLNRVHPWLESYLE